jgi:hypothetical protein
LPDIPGTEEAFRVFFCNKIAGVRVSNAVTT